MLKKDLSSILALQERLGKSERERNNRNRIRKSFHLLDPRPLQEPGKHDRVLSRP